MRAIIASLEITVPRASAAQVCRGIAAYRATEAPLLVGGEGFAVDASMIMADAHRQRGVATPDQLDPKANRAVTEYLATLDDAAFGAATPVAPKCISPVDPAARWTASWGGPAV
jgi:hypothetical protein